MAFIILCERVCGICILPCAGKTCRVEIVVTGGKTRAKRKEACGLVGERAA